MSKYNLERATDFGGENSSDYKTTSINTVYNKAKTLNEQLTNKNIYRFIKTITVVPDSYVGNLNPKIDVAELHNGVDYKYSYIKVKSPWHAWINVNKIVSENTFELCNTGENEITFSFRFDEFTRISYMGYTYKILCPKQFVVNYPEIRVPVYPGGSRIVEIGKITNDGYDYGYYIYVNVSHIHENSVDESFVANNE